MDNNIVMNKIAAHAYEKIEAMDKAAYAPVNTKKLYQAMRDYGAKYIRENRAAKLNGGANLLAGEGRTIDKRFMALSRSLYNRAKALDKKGLYNEANELRDLARAGGNIDLLSRFSTPLPHISGMVKNDRMRFLGR